MKVHEPETNRSKIEGATYSRERQSPRALRGYFKFKFQTLRTRTIQDLKLLLLVLIVCPNDISFTETNFQDKRLFDRIDNPANLQNKTHNPVISDKGAKLSSTIVKLSNNNDNQFESDKQSPVSANLPHLRAYESLRMIPKRIRQMAPAYELWLSLEDKRNIVIQRRKDIPHREHGNYESEEHRLIISTDEGNLNLDETNQDLPKGWSRKTKSRSTKFRNLRQRSTTKDSPKSEMPNEVDDSTGNVETDTDEQTSGGSQSSSDDNEKSLVDDNQVSDDTNPQPFKFLPHYDKPELMEASSSGMFESPVYPPGDAERLYSEALLVYVKDFNQFIRR